MLTFPVVSGLVVGGISLAGIAFALLAAAGFLAHESVLVVLGRRGARVRTAAEEAARARLVRLGAGAALAGALFVASAEADAWRWAMPTATLGAMVAGLLLAGRTKSLAGEVVVAAAFASLHGVVAASGGAAPSAAGLGVGVWVVSFTLATLSVHALKVRFRLRGAARGGEAGRASPSGRWLVWAAPAAAACALVLAAAAGAARWSVAGVPVGPAAAALVPKALLVLAVTALDVHPRHLKRVGWSLVLADLVTLVAVAAVVAIL